MGCKELDVTLPLNSNMLFAVGFSSDFCYAEVVLFCSCMLHIFIMKVLNFVKCLSASLDMIICFFPLPSNNVVCYIDQFLPPSLPFFDEICL